MNPTDISKLKDAANSGSQTRPATSDRALASQFERSLIALIDRLVFKSQCLAWLHAISSWLAMAGIGFIVLATLDAILRWQDPGMRWLCFGFWFALVALSGYWWLSRAWKFTADNPSAKRERLSLQIERTFPATRYRIASAIAFAQDSLSLESPSAAESASTRPSQIAGDSPTLRHESMQIAERLLREQQDLDKCLDRRQSLVRFAILLTLLLLGGILTSWQPHLAQLATARLLSPWRDIQWPKQHNLQFANLPKVIPSGEDLNIEVVDANNRLPVKIQLWIRRLTDSGAEPPEIAIEKLDMNMAAERASLVLPGKSLDQSQGINKLLLRATGGDDTSMPWQEIIVANVPQLKNFSIRIEPPAYSGQSISEVTGQSVRVLTGSRILLSGQWTSSVAEAAIDRWTTTATDTDSTHRDSQETPDKSASIPSIEISQNGTSFQIGEQRSAVAFVTSASDLAGFTVTEPSELVIRWRTKEGLEIRSPKWTFQTIADRAPIVDLLKPTDEQLVVAGTELRLQASATDDLGLKEISLKWLLNDSSITPTESSPSSERIWALDEQATAELQSQSSLQQAIDSTWRLPDESQIGTANSLTLWLEAVDSANQNTESRKVTLRFASPEQTLTELAADQADIRTKIEQALQQQRDARLPIVSTLEVLNQNGTIQQEDRDALQGAARNQRNLRNLLTQNDSSVKEGLEAIAEQLSANDLLDSDLARENAQLIEELQNLDEQQLQLAQQSIAEATQTANSLADNQELSKDDATGLSQQLMKTGDTQAAIEGRLQNMLDSLSRSEGLRQSQDDLRNIVRKQRDLRERTELLQRATMLSPSADDLQSEKTRIEVAQGELAREVERIQTNLQNNSAELQSDAPQLADSTAELADNLSQAGISSNMREAKEAVAQNNFESALERQQTAIDSLANALDQTEQAGQTTLGQLEQAIESAQNLAEQLSGQQQALANEISASSNNSENATNLQQEQQRTVRQETEKLAEQLQSLVGQNSRTELEEAIKEQIATEKSLAGNQPNEATTSSRNAADRLNEAAERLEEMTLQLQQESIADRLQQLRPLIDRLVQEEDALTGDATRSWQDMDDTLKSQLASGTPLSDEIQSQVDQQSRQYAARQLAVRQLLARSTGEFSKLPAFRLATDAILADMDQAVAGFERQQYAETAIPGVTSALKKLQQLQNAMAEAAGNDSENPEQNQNQEEPTDEAQPPSRAPLASLKLLRSMQMDLLEETAALAKLQDNGELPPTQQRRLGQLAELQERLAEQVETLANEIGQSQQ